MATGVQEIKLAGWMQEWAVRIAECRSGGMSVRAWCNGLNLEAYLNHLLTVFPECFVQKQPAEIDDLMPWMDEMLTKFWA